MYLLSTYYVVSTVVDDGGAALDMPHMVSLLSDHGRGWREKYEKR